LLIGPAALSGACALVGGVDDDYRLRPDTGSSNTTTTGTGATSTTGGNGGAAAGSGNAGGGASGGAPQGGGGAGGAGGAPDPCAMDCSLIETPQCQVAQCNVQTGMCDIVNEPNGTTCNDSALCTVMDECSGGACNGTLNNCSSLPMIPCHYATCDLNDGQCKQQPISACLPVNDGCCPSNCTPSNDIDC
jgi:hypothetical protein